MKSIIAVIMTLFTLLTSGCGTADPADPVDPADVPQVMMFTMHNNWAWGIQQSVMVIDRDGNCYSHYTDNSNYAYNYGNKPDGWIDLKEDGWYEKLLEIAENDELGGTLPESDAGYIRQNVGYFESWKDLPVKKYNDHTYDYGTRVLYGIYLDENGNPCFAELACVGDAMECLDSTDAMKFVNKTGLLRMREFD